MWRWLAAALAAHVAVLLGLTLIVPVTRTLAPPRAAMAGKEAGARGTAGDRNVWVSLDVTDVTSEPAESDGPATGASAAPAYRRAARSAARGARAKAPEVAPNRVATPPPGRSHPSGDELNGPGAQPAGLGDSADHIPGTLGTTERGIRLGLGFSEALAMVRESPDQARPAAIQTHLDRALASSDLASGRGPGGAVATAASEIAREIGPNWGSVLLATVIGSDGRVVDVELLEAAGAGWTRVPQALFRALRQLSIPLGRAMAKRGVRIVTRIASALRLPSGALAPVRVIPPGDTARQYRDAPTGNASRQPPPQGVPVLGLEFDVADIGQPRRRVVSVQTLSVTPL